MMKTATQQGKKPTMKYLVIVKGRGTAHEQHIKTTVPFYWSEAWQRWMSIPE
jgi:hypothetical protein